MESPALAVVSEDQRSLPGGKLLALLVFSPNSFPNGEATLSAYYPTAGAQPGSSLQAMQGQLFRILVGLLFELLHCEGSAAAVVDKTAQLHRYLLYYVC